LTYTRRWQTAKLAKIEEKTGFGGTGTEKKIFGIEKRYLGCSNTWWWWWGSDKELPSLDGPGLGQSFAKIGRSYKSEPFPNPAQILSRPNFFVSRWHRERGQFYIGPSGWTEYTGSRPYCHKTVQADTHATACKIKASVAETWGMEAITYGAKNLKDGYNYLLLSDSNSEDIGRR
jgi:hypothetical protein